MSKQNVFEAQLVMRLARHLILQGYSPDKITVLTTYSGQMFLMKEVSFQTLFSSRISDIQLCNLHLRIQVTFM